jgi:hypothetical protein
MKDRAKMKIRLFFFHEEKGNKTVETVWIKKDYIVSLHTSKGYTYEGFSDIG